MNHHSETTKESGNVEANLPVVMWCDCTMNDAVSRSALASS